MISDFKEGSGGVYTYVKNLSETLSREPNIDLHIVGVGDEDAAKRKRLIHLAEEQGFSLHLINDIDGTIFGKIRGSWIFTQYFYYTLRILKKILELKPDIVHIHGVTHPPLPVVGVLMRKFFKKIPLILSVHGITEMEEQYGKWGIKSRINMLFSDWVLKCILTIIVSTQAVKNLLAEKTNSEIHIIPNGINFNEIQSIKSTNNTEAKHLSILFVGRLDRIKGVEVLLRAIPIIKRNIPNFFVYIIGRGPQETELMHLAKELKNEEKVKFLGFIPEEEKYQYYKISDIVVIPSRWDVLPIVLLEAMAFGKPVVASNVGGIPYVLEDGKMGLLFECGNINDLVEKLIILLQNSELREKMGESGRERAKDFSWDAIAKRMVEIYREVMSDTKGK